jgi:ubiquinone/menaquinone biosynthesis C-methylase UbiE
MDNLYITQEETFLEMRQNYDRLSRWYDWFSSSERRFTELGLTLLRIQPGEKILEIGFGTGHALIELATAVGERGSVCGIDLSPGMIAVAKRRVQRSGMRGRITIQEGEATHIPFPDQKFQAVFMSFTLELFDSRMIPRVLAECQRVLQPEGRLGIVSLKKKNAPAVKAYEWFQHLFPKVIDCRPILVCQVLEKSGFLVNQAVEKMLWGLPVEIVIARKS